MNNSIKHVMMYSRFERFWHWTQAVLVISLLVTGFEIHGNWTWFGFEQAVQLHRIAAWTIVGLWILAIFWHLTTGEWRQYIPSSPRKLIEMMRYYLIGIFRGDDHPFHMSPKRKHNPLQRMAYLSLHLFITPLIWVSGGVYLFYASLTAMGVNVPPLGTVAMIHTAGAFIMLTFLVAHLYFTLTTSEKPFAFVRAMITGYEVEEANRFHEEKLQQGVVETLTNQAPDGRKSSLPAKLDFAQSATGLILALFMIGHMLFVASILVSKELMYSVTKFFELSFIFEGGNPAIVAVAVGSVFALFFVHALLAMRKFPINYRQFKAMKSFKDFYNHPDTNLWFIQIVTGFVMFFAGSVHLLLMLTNPGDIGPFASSDRVWSDHMWAIYLILLLAVEFHGSIGLYRLAIKWGWFEGSDSKASRKRLKIIKKVMSTVLIAIGLLTLIAYMKIGFDHSDHVGERFTPPVIEQNQVGGKHP